MSSSTITRMTGALLGFRDALRADQDLRREYAQLKKDLAGQHRDNRNAYFNAKSVFIERVLRGVGIEPPTRFRLPEWIALGRVAHGGPAESTPGIPRSTVATRASRRVWSRFWRRKARVRSMPSTSPSQHLC